MHWETWKQNTIPFLFFFFLVQVLELYAYGQFLLSDQGEDSLTLFGINLNSSSGHFGPGKKYSGK